ncbi:putative DNA-directed RNA polymerases I, II, and III subunit RPABC3 [Astathelohania contejeani]|uniref:DNA-directed RNA polymerases I, II, and III subunit RPABC3 n=1 Tax=Astathelohania contejeani TaxID=164912 RepID=A0ABQ7I0T0_9MICR|nr:putative DNA-directed RNA polymerases I, II, and III subunit RPABC3 [Thelohania contejeani]
MEIINSRFSVVAVDSEGKKFEKVSRALLKNETSSIVLDYHSILFPLSSADTVDFILYDKINESAITIPSKYNYVMNGKIYEIIEGDDDKLKIIGSLGGLYLELNVDKETKGNLNDFSNITIGLRKI